MSIESDLMSRSESKCELCAAPEQLKIYNVLPAPDDIADTAVLICRDCEGQIEGEIETDSNHWRCLNDSMWSQIPAIQVIAWRMLRRLSSEGWPQDLLDILYLEDETLNWARYGIEEELENALESGHKDCHGAALTAGDTVTLTKDLNVKGAGFTAKRGTAVRGISLVADNLEHIEGRVSGQRIVILTKFVKKSV